MEMEGTWPSRWLTGGSSNEGELENEIRILKKLTSCNGVQKFLIAFEHCGHTPSTSSSGDDGGNEKCIKSGMSKHHDCQVWIVTDWIEGRTLVEAIEAGETFSSGEVKGVGDKLLKALVRVHEKGHCAFRF